MATLRLFNTLTRKLGDFSGYAGLGVDQRPINGPPVGLYTCGPTVYGSQHLGNFRAFLFADTLKRTLLSNGYEVRHVMNITDVGHLTSDADEGEDKLEKGAQREGLTVWQVAEKYTQEFRSDFGKLNLIPPDVWSKATEHIPEMIALVQRLVANGHTYETSQALYFDVTTFRSYGRLSGQPLAAKKTGARAAVVTDPEKKHPADFALWFKLVGKFRNHTMRWPSPWGEGFPGWHIECSAMSMRYLGDQFDIHTGGIDHIPVHHANEIAQSESATGKSPFVRYWLHNEFLVVPDGLSAPGRAKSDKMAKSAGNILTVSEVERRGIDPLAFRYLCLQTHYRKPLTFSWPALEAAATGLRHLQLKVASLAGEPKIGCAEYEAAFRDSMNDDLNTSAALAVARSLLQSDYPDSAKKQSLRVFDQVLGLGLEHVQIAQPSAELKAKVWPLVVIREGLRVKKHFKKSDDLRRKIDDLLSPYGFTLEDTEDGPVIAPLR